MPIDRSALIYELCADEGVRLTVYDDATGQPLTRGMTLEGHPTIGIGRALDVNGLTMNEAKSLLSNDIDYYLHQLSSEPWFVSLDAVRQRVIINMRHQLGWAGLLRFRAMIAALIAKDYAQASSCMLASDWARIQTPARARRLAQMMASGSAPNSNAVHHDAPAAPSLVS